MTPWSWNSTKLKVFKKLRVYYSTWLPHIWKMKVHLSALLTICISSSYLHKYSYLYNLILWSCAFTVWFHSIGRNALFPVFMTNQWYNLQIAVILQVTTVIRLNVILFQYMSPDFWNKLKHSTGPPCSLNTCYFTSDVIFVNILTLELLCYGLENIWWSTIFIKKQKLFCIFCCVKVIRPSSLLVALILYSTPAH